MHTFDRVARDSGALRAQGSTSPPRLTPLAIGRRGQTTAEYAVLIGVVVAALVGMQIYVRRAMNAKLKDASDSVSTTVGNQLGIPVTTAEQVQYEPYYASSDYTTTQDSAPHHEKQATGGIFTKEGVSEQTTRTGSQSTSIPQ